MGYSPDTVSVQSRNCPTGSITHWSYVETHQTGWLPQGYIGDGWTDTDPTQPYDHSAYPRPQQEHLLHHIQSGLTSGQQYQPAEDLTDPCEFVK